MQQIQDKGASDNMKNSVSSVSGVLNQKERFCHATKNCICFQQTCLSSPSHITLAISVHLTLRHVWAQNIL